MAKDDMKERELLITPSGDLMYYMPGEEVCRWSSEDWLWLMRADGAELSPPVFICSV